MSSRHTQTHTKKTIIKRKENHDITKSNEEYLDTIDSLHRVTYPNQTKQYTENTSPSLNRSYYSMSDQGLIHLIS